MNLLAEKVEESFDAKTAENASKGKKMDDINNDIQSIKGLLLSS